jgi:hypothetical protein
MIGPRAGVVYAFAPRAGAVLAAALAALPACASFDTLVRERRYENALEMVDGPERLGQLVAALEPPRIAIRIPTTSDIVRVAERLARDSRRGPMTISELDGVRERSDRWLAEHSIGMAVAVVPFPVGGSLVLDFSGRGVRTISNTNVQLAATVGDPERCTEHRDARLGGLFGDVHTSCLTDDEYVEDAPLTSSFESLFRLLPQRAATDSSGATSTHWMPWGEAAFAIDRHAAHPDAIRVCYELRMEKYDELLVCYQARWPDGAGDGTPIPIAEMSGTVQTTLTKGRRRWRCRQMLAEHARPFCEARASSNPEPADLSALRPGVAPTPLAAWL